MSQYNSNQEMTRSNADLYNAAFHLPEGNVDKISGRLPTYKDLLEENQRLSGENQILKSSLSQLLNPHTAAQIYNTDYVRYQVFLLYIDEIRKNHNVCSELIVQFRNTHINEVLVLKAHVQDRLQQSLNYLYDLIKSIININNTQNLNFITKIREIEQGFQNIISAKDSAFKNLETQRDEKNEEIIFLSRALERQSKIIVVMNEEIESMREKIVQIPKLQFTVDLQQTVVNTLSQRINKMSETQPAPLITNASTICDAPQETEGKNPSSDLTYEENTDSSYQIYPITHVINLLGSEYTL